MKKKPCPECPFLKSRGYLKPERARSIAKNAASRHGEAFWCHKTVQKARKRDGTTGPALHCAGSAALSEKLGVQTQALRIALRLGMYDPADLEQYFDLVYDSIDDMERGHTNSSSKV